MEQTDKKTLGNLGKAVGLMVISAITLAILVAYFSQNIG